MERQKVVITSANAPHYIALDACNEDGWRWTRNFDYAYRFPDKAAAEAFAAAHLPGMGEDVWYLGHLW